MQQRKLVGTYQYVDAPYYLYIDIYIFVYSWQWRICLHNMYNI